MKKRCRYCSSMVSSNHYCPVKEDYIDFDDSGSFIASAAIAAVTDSVLLGTVLGGDVSGAIIGDLLDGNLFD